MKVRNSVPFGNTVSIGQLAGGGAGRGSLRIVFIFSSVDLHTCMHAYIIHALKFISERKLSCMKNTLSGFYDGLLKMSAKVQYNGLHIC